MLTLKGSLRGSNLPAEVRQLSLPPEQLFVDGDLAELLARPRLSVVGSRRPTTYGKLVTTDLVSQLASSGVVIVSGLAFGIDVTAHKACLQAGGQTIAVLPGSIEEIYPSGHAAVTKEIIKTGGALVSEYPKGQEPLRHQFIARNRLIAALGEGLLVTEATINSGTMHTVRFTLELGKPVFAVPGNINSPLSAGCNQLIKSGATPVTSIDDILQTMDWQLADNRREGLAANEPEQRIIDLLIKGLTDGAEIQQQSGLDPAQFNQHLTMLELNARIRPLGANHWALIN